MTDTPAESSPATTRRTSAVVNWCRTAWLPSRRVLSVNRTKGLSFWVVISHALQGLCSVGFGDQLAGAHRGRRHDVQVSGPFGQVVAVPADLQEDPDPSVAVPERVGVVELGIAAQGVAGHVPPHLGGRPMDRLG